MTRDREANFRILVERVADRANLLPHQIYGPDNHRYTVTFNVRSVGPCSRATR